MQKPKRDDYTTGAHGNQKYRIALAEYNRNVKSRNESLHSSKKPKGKYDSRGRLKIRDKVDRMTRLPGGSRHQGGEIGQKSDKPSEGKFKTTPPSTRPQSEAGQVEQQDKMTPAQTKKSLESYNNRQKENKPDELAAAKKKLKRHASGKNSIAKSKLQLKIRDLESKKKKKGG